MATGIITNAAGPTTDFFYYKGIYREESISDTELVLSARIVSGPFRGERSTTTFIGEFDQESGLARVSEVRESVGGQVHVSLEFDRRVPLDAILIGDIREPLTLIGNSFSNVLVGDRTADKLIGNAGADTLVGFRGADTLVGGRGADSFVFLSVTDSNEAKRDTIRDFGTGADRIDLAAIDADSGTGGDQAFDFVGAGRFTETAGELRIAGGGRFVLGDTDGDGSADLVIRLHGAPTVVESDFFL